LTVRPPDWNTKATKAHGGHGRRLEAASSSRSACDRPLVGPEWPGTGIASPSGGSFDRCHRRSRADSLMRATGEASGPRDADRELPSALERVDEILRRASGRRLAVFLDFDGTLAPIVERPELATLDDATRQAVARLARACPVAVVSGRDRADVAARVGLEG